MSAILAVKLKHLDDRIRNALSGNLITFCREDGLALFGHTPTMS